MNWYKQSKVYKTSSKTLYHGTSIDKVPNIQKDGLVPTVGDFVNEFYSEYYEALDTLPELTFATDKDQMQKAWTAMVNSISVLLKKDFHKVNYDNIVEYGALIIIPGEGGSPEGAQGFEKRKTQEELPEGETYDKEWDMYYSSDYPTVEPGDYYSDSGAYPVKILTGKKMVNFLERFIGPLDYGIESLRKRLIQLVMRYETIKDPNINKAIMLEKIRETIKNFGVDELRHWINKYKNI